MIALARALSAETLKLKRTLALAMVLVSPLVIILLNVFTLLRMRQYSAGEPIEVWDLLVRNGYGLWLVMMLPLFVTLETALLGGLEHGPVNWKHLFALPIPRWSIYAAKLIVILAIVALGMGVLIAGNWLAGLVLGSLHLEGFTLADRFPWGQAFEVGGLAYALSLLMIAIQLWIANRWSSFAVASGSGMVATVMSFLLINSDTWSKIFPWSLPINAMGLLVDGTPVAAQALLIAILGGLAVSIVGGWDVIRRDVL